MNDLFSTLDDERLGHLAYILHSPAYVEFFEPFLQGIERNLTEKIIDPDKSRKDRESDDYLRGGIMVVRAILTAPHFIIEERKMKVAEEAAIKKDEDFYNERALAGSIGPLPYQRMSDEGNDEQEQTIIYDPATDY